MRCDGETRSHGSNSLIPDRNYRPSLFVAKRNLINSNSDRGTNPKKGSELKALICPVHLKRKKEKKKSWNKIKTAFLFITATRS